MKIVYIIIGMNMHGNGFYSHLYNSLKRVSEAVTASLEVSKQKNSIRVLDGVRGIACLAVLTYHLDFLGRNYTMWHPSYQIPRVLLGSLLLFGDSGVILFFLLSGFLLFLPFAKAMLFESQWPSIRRFYIRRIFRIVPGYYFALFTMIIFFHSDYLLHDHLHDLWLFLTFRMDFPETYQQINGPFWTLAIEFQFYLLLPLIAWLVGLVVCWGTARLRLFKLTFCLLGMVAWGILTRHWGLHLSDANTLDPFIPHSVADALKPYIYGSAGKFFEVFAVGMLICTIYVYVKNAPSTHHLSITMRRISFPCFLLGSLILVLLSIEHFYIINTEIVFHHLARYQNFLVAAWPQWQALAYALGYGLCLFALLHGTDRLRRPFEWVPLRWAGLISYSLYMWHLPFLFLFTGYIYPGYSGPGWRHMLSLPVFYFWAAVVIIPLCVMFYRCIEMPGIRIGEILLRRLETRTRKQPVEPDTTPPSQVEPAVPELQNSAI